MILFEASIPPDLRALSALRKDLSARLDTLCPTDPVRQAILLTLSEIGANTILHADPMPEQVTVRWACRGRRCRLTLRMTAALSPILTGPAPGR